MLTGRHVLIAVSLGITLVFGLAGWRFLHGETEQPVVARSAAPVARPVAPPPVASETSASLNQVELAQQFLVDDLQLMASRLAKQETEIKRLRAELETLGQKYETLSSFASTAKEARPTAAVEPPRNKKKKRRPVKLAKKR